MFAVLFETYFMIIFIWLLYTVLPFLYIHTDTIVEHIYSLFLLCFMVHHVRYKQILYVYFYITFYLEKYEKKYDIKCISTCCEYKKT